MPVVERRRGMNWKIAFLAFVSVFLNLITVLAILGK